MEIIMSQTGQGNRRCLDTTMGSTSSMFQVSKNLCTIVDFIKRQTNLEKTNSIKVKTILYTLNIYRY